MTKGVVDFRIQATLGHLDICIPTEELEKIATSLVGKPVYDNISDHSIKHIIGRITNAKLVDGRIDYEAILSEEGQKLMK